MSSAILSPPVDITWRKARLHERLHLRLHARHDELVGGTVRETVQIEAGGFGERPVIMLTDWLA